jgi:hypothetical protein
VFSKNTTCPTCPSSDIVPFVGCQHPKRGILGQPLGVGGVLVAGQAAIDRLAEEVR